MKTDVSCATVIAAKVLDGYRVELTFSDGARGIVNLAARIIGRGGIFQAIEDERVFRQVRVDEELGTLVWPNGADICPDLLYAWSAGEPVTSPETAIMKS